MVSTHQSFLDTLAQDFCENRLESVAEGFVYPMPFYAGDRLQVYGAAVTMVEGLALYRDAVRNAGIHTLRARIIAQGLTIRGYSHVWVEWDHLDAAGRCLRISQVRYVLHQNGAALFPRIELVDYKVTAFPEISQEFEGVATA